MSEVRLSLCMPTYNFGAFIGETLDSILPQLEPGVEIVILDGGSTDDTERIVQGYTHRYPQIAYVRQPARGGIDRDMARSVELARGDYCWLFSADDLMKPGALKRVLNEARSGHDLYLGGLTLCDRNMAVIREHAVSRAPWGAEFELRDSVQRARYFSVAQTTTAFFSFMGSLVFRRRRWLEHPLEENYVGSCWAHVVRILRMIPHGLKLKYLGESLLLKRGENDSFMEKGLVHRYAIAIDGYHRIGADVFGDGSMEAAHFRRVITNEFPFTAMFISLVHCRRQGREGDISELDRLVKKTYSDVTVRNFLQRVGYQALRRFGHQRFVYFAYRVARSVYRAIRRRRPTSTGGASR